MAETLCDVADSRFDRGSVGHVETNAFAAMTRILEVRRNRRGAVVGRRGAGHARTGACKRKRDGLADAPRGACYERGLLVEHIFSWDARVFSGHQPWWQRRRRLPRHRAMTARSDRA